MAGLIVPGCLGLLPHAFADLLQLIVEVLLLLPDLLVVMGSLPGPLQEQHPLVDELLFGLPLLKEGPFYIDFICILTQTMLQVDQLRLLSLDGL